MTYKTINKTFCICQRKIDYPHMFQPSSLPLPFMIKPSSSRWTTAVFDYMLCNDYPASRILSLRQAFSKWGGNKKQNAHLPPRKLKAPHLLNGRLSQAPCAVRVAVSSSFWIHKVHNGASWPILQQEFPLWTNLPPASQSSAVAEATAWKRTAHQLLAAVVAMVAAKVLQVFWMQLFSFRRWVLLVVNAVSCTHAANGQHTLQVWWILPVLTSRRTAQH